MEMILSFNFILKSENEEEEAIYYFVLRIGKGTSGIKEEKKKYVWETPRRIKKFQRNKKTVWKKLFIVI